VAERAINIKLSVKDQEQVLAALRAVGKEGETMAGRLEASSKKAAVETSALGKAAATTAAALGQLKSPILALTGQLGGMAPLLSQSTLLFGGITAAVGALAAGFVILFNRAKEAAQWAEDTLKFAKSLDSSVREVQALEFAARNLNVETATFRDGMKSLQARVFEASAGMGKAKEVFKQLGIEVRDANGNVKPTLEIFKELAAVLQQFDRADRLTIMRRVFGGTELAPLLKDGPEGLRKMIENAERLGVVMDEGPLKAAAETNKHIREIENLTSTKLRNAFAEISPVLLGVKIIAHEILTVFVKMAEVMFKISGISAAFQEIVRRAQLSEVGRYDEDIAAARKAADALRESAERNRLAKLPYKDISAAAETGVRELEELQRRRDAVLKKIEADTKKGDKYDGPPEVTRRLTDPDVLKKGVAAHEQALKEIEKRENEAARKATDDRFQRIDVQSAQELDKFQKLLADKVIGEQEYARVSEAIWKKNQAEKDEISRQATDKWVTDQIQAHEKAAKEALKPWQNFGDDIGSIITKGFEDGFASFNFSDVRRSVTRFAGGLLNQRVLNPALAGLGLATPVAGAEGSPLFKLGATLSGGATLFGIPLFGGLQGTAGEQELVSRAAVSAGQPIPGGQGLVGGAIGGAATGFSVGSLAGMIPGLNAQNAQIGGTIGGTIGAVVGSIIPGIGTVIGGLLGSVLGSLGGGLLGPKKTSVGPGANALLGSPGGRAGVLGVGADNGGNAGGARDLGTALATAVNNLVDTLGFTSSQIGGVNAAVTPGGFRVGFINSVYSSGTDAEAVIKQGLYAMLKQGDFFFQGIGEATAKAIANSVASDLEGLLADIEFAKSLDDIVEGLVAAKDELKAVELQARKAAQEQVKAITDFVDKARDLGFAAEADTALSALVGQLFAFTDKPEALSETAKALATLGATFRVLRENAEALGITEARIAAGEIAAKDELRKGFDVGIAQQILAIVDPMAAALAEFDKASAKRLEEARLAGADLVAVERLTALERQKVVEQASGQVTSSLQNFYEEITFGGLSGASPLASLEGVRGSFLAASAQGDRSRIEDLGRSLLTQSRGAFASGSGFQNDLALVQNAVGILLGPENAVIAAISASGGEQVRELSRIYNKLGEIANENVALREEVARQNGVLQRLLAR